jgi:hypothetical protein
VDTDATTPDTEPVPAWVNRARLVGVLVLSVVAAIGAAASYTGLQAGFAPWFPYWIAAALPLLVDGVILGSSLRWLAGIRLGRPVHAWRLLAHTGVAMTIVLNAAAAQTPAAVPWHVVAPAVWAVLVELVARDAIGDHRATVAELERIPFRLWVTAPLESSRTWIHLARTTAAVRARRDVAVHGAARTMLRIATPTVRGWRVRRELVRRMRSGALAPQAVLDACSPVDGRYPSPVEVLRAAVTTILADSSAAPARRARSTQPPTMKAPGPLTHPAADRDEAGPAAPLPLARPHPTSDIDDLTAARAQQVIDTLVATGQRVNLANFGRAWRASWSIEQGRLRVIYGATKSSAKTRGVA